MPALEEALNLNHMELLVHLVVNGKDIFKLAGFRVDVSSIDNPLAFALPTALEHPYLLHQLLAFSASHLAFLNPDKAGFYAHQADVLQTRAISLFNST